MVLPRHRKSEKDGIVPTPASGKGWDRPGTTERRGMASPWHHRAERDGLIKAPHIYKTLILKVLIVKYNIYIFIEYTVSRKTF